MLAVEVVLARHEEQLQRLKDDMDSHVIRTEKALDALSTNSEKLLGKLEEIRYQYHNRLPNWASFLFTVLTGCVMFFLGRVF